MFLIIHCRPPSLGTVLSGLDAKVLHDFMEPRLDRAHDDLPTQTSCTAYFRAILQDLSHTFALFWVIFSWSLLDLRFLPKLRIASDHIAWKTSKHMDPTKWWSFLTGGGWWMILLPIVTTLHGYGVMKIVVPWFCNMNDGYLANDAQLHIFVF